MVVHVITLFSDPRYIFAFVFRYVNARVEAAVERGP